MDAVARQFQVNVGFAPAQRPSAKDFFLLLQKTRMGLWASFSEEKRNCNHRCGLSRQWCPLPSLQKLNHRIEVPRSVPGMVTDRLLVMNFLDGVPITRLERHTQK